MCVGDWSVEGEVCGYGEAVGRWGGGGGRWGGGGGVGVGVGWLVGGGGGWCVGRCVDVYAGVGARVLRVLVLGVGVGCGRV